MTPKTSYFKNNFAKFLAKNDQENFVINKERKIKLFKNISGKVLEIGPGTGANFPFFTGKDIEWTGIEPNLAMNNFLYDSSRSHGLEISIVNSKTENIEQPDETYDFVISTEVLCSVNDLVKSLEEIKRVLKPKGKFLFLEHVVDKNNSLRRIVQKSVPFTPWKCYSDGCHPARDIGRIIHQAGFSKVEYTEYMREGNGIIISINRPHICGWALK